MHHEILPKQYKDLPFMSQVASPIYWWILCKSGPWRTEPKNKSQCKYSYSFGLSLFVEIHENIDTKLNWGEEEEDYGAIDD